MQAKAARMIEIDRIGEDDPLAFAVTVRDAASETHHHVTLARADARRLAERHLPEQCIEAAFRFLLDHEPKEAILQHFDISVIARYFPQFERELPAYLAQL